MKFILNKTSGINGIEFFMFVKEKINKISNISGVILNLISK